MSTTGPVQTQRELQFHSLDDVLAEAERLASAERLVTRGNWSLGQILLHLARAMDMSIDGAEFKVPFFIRIVAPLMKKRILRKMPSGFKLPASAKKLTPDDATTTDQGMQALRDAAARLSKTTDREPHPVFGKMSCDEWNLLHLRHAEMHLSFVDVGD